MQIHLEGLTKSKSRVDIKAIVKHGEEEIVFDASRYGRQSFISNGVHHDPFEYTNYYLETLTNEKQHALFERYKLSYNAFSIIPVDRERIHNEVKHAILDILTSVKYEDVLNWVRSTNKVYIPPNIKPEFDNDIIRNNTGTREQTYIIDDYQHLLAFTIILRLVLPILGEYRRSFGDSDHKHFGYLKLYDLISEAPILNTPASSKLVDYINKTFEKEAQENSFSDFTLVGIPADMVPDWLYKTLLVRRLSTCEYNNPHRDTSLVTSIHKYIRQELNGTKVKELRTKYLKAGAGMDDDKQSTYESYKIISDLPPGTQVEINWYSEHTDHALYLLARDIDMDLVKKALDSSLALMDIDLTDTHLTLVKLVMDPFISHNAIKHLEKEQVVRLLGLTQAILFHHGHKYLSLLATAIDEGAGDDAVIATALDSKARVSSEKAIELFKWYPYHSTSDVDVDTITKADNPITEDIANLSDDISSKAWFLTADESLILDALGKLDRRPMSPYDLKPMIVDLLIDIGSRKWLPDDKKLIA